MSSAALVGNGLVMGQSEVDDRPTFPRSGHCRQLICSEFCNLLGSLPSELPSKDLHVAEEPENISGMIKAITIGWQSKILDCLLFVSLIIFSHSGTAWIVFPSLLLAQTAIALVLISRGRTKTSFSNKGPLTERS